MCFRKARSVDNIRAALQDLSHILATMYIWRTADTQWFGKPCLKLPDHHPYMAVVKPDTLPNAEVMAAI